MAQDSRKRAVIARMGMPRTEKPLDIRGWFQYYGRFYRSGLYPLRWYLNRVLARWATRSGCCVLLNALHSSLLTGSWVRGVALHWEPYELRGSCTVLRERGGATPPRHSPSPDVEGEIHSDRVFYDCAYARTLGRDIIQSHPPAPTARLFSVCVKCRQFGRNKSSLELSRSGMVLRYLFARGSKATTTSNRLPPDFSM